MGKGQGHEHGECDVARRVWEHDDLDENLMGPSVWHMLVPAWCVFGVWSGAMPSGVAAKRHDDPMFVVSSDTLADQLGFILFGNRLMRISFFSFQTESKGCPVAHSKTRTGKHGLIVSIIWQ